MAAAGAGAAQAEEASVSPIVALITGDKNERGIPSAVFIDDIAAFIAKHGLVIDDLYGELTTLHGKYKLMEASLEDGRTRAKKKAPELESSLEAIKMLEAKQEANETASAFYQLADNIFTKADIKPQNKVALWLGASVMVEYSYEEATKLLGEQLLAARTKISNNTADLTFLRDQIITTEVNRARVYNYTVLENRKQKEAAAAKAKVEADAAAAAAPGSEPAAAK